MDNIVIGVDPGCVRDFGKGALFDLVDIVVGLASVTFTGLRGGGRGGAEFQRESLLRAYEFYRDPKAALRAWALGMLRVELWSSNQAEAAGRTPVDALTFFLAPLKLS